LASVPSGGSGGGAAPAAAAGAAAGGAAAEEEKQEEKEEGMFPEPRAKLCDTDQQLIVFVPQRRKSQTRIWVSVFSTNRVPFQTQACYYLRKMANSVRGLLGEAVRAQRCIAWTKFGQARQGQ
jgi:hypothetical protein